MMEHAVKVQIRDLSFHYHSRRVLDRVDMEIYENSITSISGPSGQGKSSFLTVLNRLYENIDGARMTGRVAIDLGAGLEDIHRRTLSLSRLRQQVGMVFQIPNPLPMSIYRNVSFPLMLSEGPSRKETERRVRRALEMAFLWDEVKDRLNDDARRLSGGQQQRLCIARALVSQPQVLLLDEPTSSLDETSLGVIESLLLELARNCTIIIVSHYADQVRRIADRKFVLSSGKLLAK